MTLLINILLGFHVTVAILMILVILMQRPKSEGLGAAFGGGVTENLFGAQTTNVLTRITSWLATFFFLLTFGLSILYAHKADTKSDLTRELLKDLPPAATASPTPGQSPSSTPAPSGTTPNPTPAAAGATSPANASVTPASSPVGAVKPAGSPSQPGGSPGPTVTLSTPAKDSKQ